jgi:hypothetical protein
MLSCKLRSTLAVVSIFTLHDVMEITNREPFQELWELIFFRAVKSHFQVAGFLKHIVFQNNF